MDDLYTIYRVLLRLRLQSKQIEIQTLWRHNNSIPIHRKFSISDILYKFQGMHGNRRGIVLISCYPTVLKDLYAMFRLARHI